MITRHDSSVPASTPPRSAPGPVLSLLRVRNVRRRTSSLLALAIVGVVNPIAGLQRGRLCASAADDGLEVLGAHASHRGAPGDDGGRADEGVGRQGRKISQPWRSPEARFRCTGAVRKHHGRVNRPAGMGRTRRGELRCIVYTNSPGRFEAGRPHFTGALQLPPFFADCAARLGAATPGAVFCDRPVAGLFFDFSFFFLRISSSRMPEAVSKTASTHFLPPFPRTLLALRPSFTSRLRAFLIPMGLLRPRP